MTSISSPALAVLQSLTASSNDPLSNLIGIINGTTTAATGGDPVAALVDAEKNQDKEVTRQENDPQTKRDVQRFLAVAAKATDLKSLLADPTARKVFLTANGLGDQADYTALAVKALSSDPNKTGNLASTLADTRWLSLAKTFQFATKGLSVLKQQSVLANISNGYAEVQWRQSLDTSTPGLSAALDFRSRASTIKSVDQILGDSNLRTVVTGALGIPKQIAYQPLEAQENAISSRIDITKFKDPAFVESFTRRFLIANAATASSGSSTQSSGLIV